MCRCFPQGFTEESSVLLVQCSVIFWRGKEFAPSISPLICNLCLRTVVHIHFLIREAWLLTSSTAVKYSWNLSKSLPKLELIGNVRLKTCIWLLQFHFCRFKKWVTVGLYVDLAFLFSLLFVIQALVTSYQCTLQEYFEALSEKPRYPSKIIYFSAFHKTLCPHYML